MLYYVPFLSLERMHLNKPPVQIPIHLAKNGFNVALMVSEADAAIDSKIIIKETLNKGDSQRINKSLTENTLVK